MRVQVKIYSIFAMSVVFLSLLFYLLNATFQQKTEITHFNGLINDATVLVDLQNKWTNHEENKKVILKITSTFNPNLSELKGDIHSLAFENLNQVNFSRLSSLLLNSNLILQEIDVKKNNDKISLHVKIKI
ncbi:MAG: hypothetical protein J0647_03955 [Campylobacteraceae bacterium]|nr:hypothetical protein [Campylobacteraceae bacterium]